MANITKSNTNSLDRLPIHKRRYVENRAAGMTKKKAAASIGVSPQTAAHYEKQPDIQTAYRDLMQKAIPAKRLVQLVKGGTEAKMPVYNSSGKKTGERADWKTRRPYIEMAAEHSGYVEDKGGPANAIQIVVQHIGRPDGTAKPVIEATTKTIGAE